MINKTRSWLIWGGLLVLSLIVAGAYSHDEVLHLFHAWQGEEYSHAFLLIPLALLLGWTGIEKSGVKPAPSSAGLLFVVAGILINICGVLVANLWLSNISVLFFLFGLCHTFLGLRATLAAWKGFVLLFFTIPLPPIVMAQFTAKMQLVSSSIGSAFLDALSFSVYREGNVIDLGIIKLQVAEACSGLRYFFPLLSLGFLIAVLLRIPGWMRLIIVASALPITIIMNALRIMTIGIAANVWGQDVAVGLVHDLEGWVVFAFCLLMLIGEVWIFSLFVKERLVIEDFLPSWKKVLTADAGRPPVLLGLLLMALLACGVGGKVYLQHHQQTIVAREVSFDAFPLTIGPWKGKTQTLSAEEMDVLRLSSYFLADFIKADAEDPANETVNFYIAYYADQRLGASPHSPKVCLPGGGWEMSVNDDYSFSVPSAGKTLSVNRAVLRKGTATRLIYFWLRERGYDVSSTFEVKWRLLADALQSGQSDGALIRVTMPVPDIEKVDEQDKVLQEFVSDIWGNLNAFVPETPNDK